MATRTLSTRIKLLVKTYAEWQLIKDTFIPLEGEMCIINVPAETGALTNEPALIFKVGDGTTTFEDLPYGSAKAADVYGWAKKEALDFSDLDANFLAELETFVDEHSVATDTKYQIVADGDNKWKLQKSTDGETWEDATGVIDLTATLSSLDAEIAKKVDKTLTGANGKALIFNETDGGGAKFEHNDGTNSFVGVNDGGANGLAGQLYVVNKDTKVGARLNMTADGFFYTNGASSYAYTADDEIVTKKDIAAIEGGMHYIGKTALEPGETVADALNRMDPNPTAGDIVIVGTTEYIYSAANTWDEVGDEGNYATKAELAAETSDRQAADATLQANINKKVDKTIDGTNGKADIFNEGDGGGAMFTHNDKTKSFVGVNDGGANGLTAQIYSKNTDTNIGTRINVTNDAIYYTKGLANGSYQAKDEIAVKEDLEDYIAETDTLILDCNL